AWHQPGAPAAVCRPERQNRDCSSKWSRWVARSTRDFRAGVGARCGPDRRVGRVCPRPGTESLMTDLPTASGSFGDKPTLTFPDSQAPAELAVQVLSPGEGPLVEAGQTIEVNYYGQVWGGSMFDNSYDRGSS